MTRQKKNKGNYEMFWSRNNDEIHKKIDELVRDIKEYYKDSDNRLDNIEKILVAQEINLKDHMRRSDHLEQIVEQNNKKTEDAIAPMKKHINMVEGVFKFLGISGIVVSMFGGIAKLFGLI